MSNSLILLSGGSGGGGGNAGQKGRIWIDNLVFRDASGAIWPWRGVTAFTLYLKWLQGREGAVDPLLSNWLANCPGLNVVRVLGMVNSFAHLHPQEWPDYYSQLKPFADHLLNVWGIRVEFVIFADSGDIMPDPNQQNVHASIIVDTLSGCENVFIEVANEPSQHTNLDGGDARVFDIYYSIRSRGLLVATGAGDGDYPGDYITVHTPRDDQWPRKAKDLLDVRNITHSPCVGDEPMGCAEVFIDGKRDTNPRNFADYAATAQLEGAGATFHSDAGINGEVFGPVTAACAKAWFAAAAWVPPQAQLEQFLRGQVNTPCMWTHAPGDEPGPCQHDDSIEIRSYGKIIGSECWVTQVQTQRASPTVCGGWAIDSVGPSTGLTKFRRV